EKPLAVRRSMIFVLIMRIRLAVRRSLALIAAVSCSRSCASRFVDMGTTYHLAPTRALVRPLFRRRQLEQARLHLRRRSHAARLATPRPAMSIPMGADQ